MLVDNMEETIIVYLKKGTLPEKTYEVKNYSKELIVHL